MSCNLMVYRLLYHIYVLVGQRRGMKYSRLSALSVTVHVHVYRDNPKVYLLSIKYHLQARMVFLEYLH